MAFLDRASVGANVETTRTRRFVSPIVRRMVLLALVAGAGVMADRFGAPEIAGSDAELVRLLQLMAALKALMSAAIGGVVLWRLARPIGLARFGAYGAACAAMSAGVMLIWEAAHLGTGALLLHGGLAAGVALLWTDPAVRDALAAAVVARRRQLR